MNVVPTTAPVAPAAALAERNASRLVFLIAGLSPAAWAPMVPYAKARAGLDDGALGLLLLGLGLGSIIAMPVAGALVTRFGCRRVIVPAVAIMGAALPLLGVLSGFTGLMLALFLFGIGVGALDCAMNVQAILVERRTARPIMSGLHGLYSVGGIVGAGAVSGLLGLGASPLLAVLCVVVALCVALGLAWPNLLTDGSASGAPLFAVPRGPILLIGALCFVVFLAEGAMLDWSAVFLTTEHDLDAAWGGLGFAVFSVAMTVCRLTGDAIVARLGRTRVVVAGALVAAAGLGLATLLPSVVATMLGFALIGIGCANIVPVLFTAIGNQSAMPEGAAVAAVTTLAYAGILVGPAGIGFVASASSLSVPLLMLAGMLILVAATAPRVLVPVDG
ncbi:MFS transporter [Methylobacterium terrae]|uniref:MFS transporter n=1 Tax=Methylobacterium terrae TaxID=2202827 RepID=A0A2U8WVR0_9HYPH|nr:MFS transporter [Methylobacterium terrae]AWN50197.1 MFS transporter [Methylobacterium terrae]